MQLFGTAVRIKPDWRTVLSSILIVLSFPPWGFAHLIWIALIPWFFAISNSSSKKDAFIQGLWLCFLMTLGGFYWVAYVLNEFGGVPWSISVAGLLIFSLFNEIQFLIFAPIQFTITKSLVAVLSNGWKTARILFIASLFYAGCDAILPKLFLDTLGHALFDSPWLRQAADLGGAPLLTVVIYFANASGWHFLRSIKDRREPSVWPAIRTALPALSIVFTLLVGLAAYGYWRSNQVGLSIASPTTRLQLGVIQANIGDFEKLAAKRGIVSAGKRVVETFIDLSDKALSMDPKPEALVWPETAYPSTFRTPETADELARDQQIEAYVRDRGVPLLFGGYDHSAGKDYNALFFLSPHSSYGNEGDLLVYRKNMLLLFGEYIPGAQYIRLLRELFPQVANFGQGHGPDSLPVPLPVNSSRKSSVLAGPIICYEALNPDYVIRTARKGAEFILNITNDSWFGPYGEPELHLALTVFRSIETRLPQLRSTNTGISSLILPNGEITHATNKFQPEIMNVSVPIIAPVKTLMLMWGNWFGKVSFAFGLVGLAYPWVAERIRRKKAVASTRQTPV